MAETESTAGTDGDVWTVRRILEWTIPYLRERGSTHPRLDAEILLAHAKQCPRIQLYTQYDKPLTEAERTLMRSLVKRRATAEPVAYLVNHREFFSLDFEVNRHVFIPRPDTETLVVTALEVLKPLASAKVLELCTGSACVSVAIAKNHPGTKVTTVELNADTAEVAARNIGKHHVEERVELLQGDLFEPLREGERFNLIVSNPPYIPTAEIETLEPDVRDHEPRMALDGGADGLDLIRKIIHRAPDFLVPDGWLMMELDSSQAENACALLRQRGFQQVEAMADLSHNLRIVVGCRSGSTGA
ncbi:Release factor glutamine methyltransferase [Thalassoglobus neptunius]|uniref:Release factor glutamine methyltransferase n=1 Tax=Thalassoglobus neptunius TaxID=1938619 RepID=A0A5C5X214_9PLAN|nr:peptide chain release factor N(5)-glutamine methyltransferase [Thalassoglobus neptunius]TWT57067.1 Release factor glutamine methyltransferase [Thalassoglobus neptunius]